MYLRLAFMLGVLVDITRRFPKEHLNDQTTQAQNKSLNLNQLFDIFRMELSYVF